MADEISLAIKGAGEEIGMAIGALNLAGKCDEHSGVCVSVEHLERRTKCIENKVTKAMYLLLANLGGVIFILVDQALK